MNKEENNKAGRDDIKAFITDFRAAFPDLNFWGTAGSWKKSASTTA